MRTLNRRRFSMLGLSGIATAALVACGNEVGNEDSIKPTKISNAEGAPPTLAPMATPGGSAPEGESGGGETSGGGGGPVLLEAHDPYNWSTNDLQAAPGQTIHVVNTGFLPHDFSIDGVGEKLVDLPSNGAEGDWTVPDDWAVGDTYTFYCAEPGHRAAGMEGTLTIVEAGAAGASEEASPEEATPEEGAAEEGGAAGGGSPQTIEVHSLDTLKFDPDAMTASPGDTIHVVNEGFLPHDFAIDEFGGILVDLPGNGTSGDWTIPDDAAEGDYKYYCTIPGHDAAGMHGTLTITAGGGGGGGDTAGGDAGAAEAETPEEAPADEAAAGGGGGGGQTIEVHSLDTLKFDPETISAKAGDTIHVVNEGFLPHDFAIDEFGGILVDLPSNGASGDWTIPDDAAAGDYKYYCTIPGHDAAGMHGTLTIG